MPDPEQYRGRRLSQSQKNLARCPYSWEDDAVFGSATTRRLTALIPGRRSRRVSDAEAVVLICLFKSTDHGVTWTGIGPRTSTGKAIDIQRVRVNPADNRILYAMSPRGVLLSAKRTFYRSSDGPSRPPKGGTRNK